MGTIPRKVPKVREGSFSPSLLDPRKRAERALVAVVPEEGVSTRRVDDLVQALGMTGLSQSQVSSASGGCQELDAAVERFRRRRLEGAYPDVWLDSKRLGSAPQ